MLSVIQYTELAYLCYELRYVYAGILFCISTLSILFGNQSLYRERSELYNAIGQRHMVPFVQQGRIR